MKRVTLNERNHQSIDSNELNNNILWNIISINQQVKCEKQSHLAHTSTTPKEPYQNVFIIIGICDKSIVSDIVIQVPLFT